jgi:hypothetical protein
VKNTYTFNPDNIKINNKSTWEWENTSTSKDFGKWTFVSQNNPPVEVPPPPSNEEMIKSLLPHMEDKGMFEDIVDWLRKDAPKKLRGLLNGLYAQHMILPPVPYEYLCRVVYELEFRANEVVENRMILGTNNQWVKRYFEDFPLRTELAH